MGENLNQKVKEKENQQPNGLDEFYKNISSIKALENELVKELLDEFYKNNYQQFQNKVDKKFKDECKMYRNYPFSKCDEDGFDNSEDDSNVSAVSRTISNISSIEAVENKLVDESEIPYDIEDEDSNKI